MSLSSIYLDAFYVCAQVGHFTKASGKLAITQSALSQRIKNLEDELSVTLLIRDPSGVKLTEAGMQLLRYCQQKESLENEAIQAILDPKNLCLNGVIRIGGYSSVMKSAILPAIAALIKQNPFIKIYFISREMDELPHLLRNGEIDFMIYDKEMNREDLVSKKIGIERNVLIQKKNYTGGEVYLDHDEEDQTTKKYLSKFNPKVKFERSYYDDSYGIIDAVKLGLGKAVIPIHLIKSDKELVIVNKENQMQNSVVLYYYKQDFYTKLQSAIIDSLVVGCRIILN